MANFWEMDVMSRRKESLSIEEQDFIFGVVIKGLESQRDNLDRDLFALLALRLLKAGYTRTQLDAIVATANQAAKTE